MELKFTLESSHANHSYREIAEVADATAAVAYIYNRMDMLQGLIGEDDDNTRLRVVRVIPPQIAMSLDMTRKPGSHNKHPWPDDSGVAKEWVAKKVALLMAQAEEAVGPFTDAQTMVELIYWTSQVSAEYLRRKRAGEALNQ